jgi:hypothetical protein
MNKIDITVINYWKATQINAEFLRDTIVKGYMRQFPIKTECVLTSDKPTHLLQSGRYWYYTADLGIRTSPDGNSSWREQLALVEIWEDCGDDGHTDFCHIGYALMTPTDADLYAENIGRSDTWISLTGIGIDS